MNLPVSEIKTNCEKCTYAIFKDNNQVGCKTERLDKFKVLQQAVYHESENSSWYLLKRFCNLYREKNQSVDEAREQVKTSFGIVVFDHDDSFSSTALESLKDIKYDKNKYKIIISSKHKKNINSLLDYVMYFNDLHGVECNLCLELEEENKELIDYNAFSKCGSQGYAIKIKSDTPIPFSLLSYVDKSVNDDLDKIILYECKNILVIPTWYLKYNYLNFRDFDLMVSDLRSNAIAQNMYRKYER